MDLLRLAECPRGTWLEFMTRVFHNAWNEWDHEPKDDLEFAEILNWLHEGQHTNQDIAKLKKCEKDMMNIRNMGVTNFAFPTNALVDAHNQEQYEVCKQQKLKINAQDSVFGDHSNEVK